MGGETVPSSDLGFGRSFTEHMAVARCAEATGWTETAIVSFHDLSLSPAAMVFHYGQAIFEGLKAFRQPDGTVVLFRPEENAARFNRSARRLAMPELQPGVFTAACAELVRADERWVPSGPGQSLYLRPMMVATEAALGVRPADEYLFAVIASPVDAYFSAGVKPIKVWATKDHVRAAPGGTGSAKCAGNYAASLASKQQAADHSCDEVLWLDSVEHSWIEELGGMNVIFVATDRGGPTLLTPPVQSTILDGVTRKSLLELGRRLGYNVVEKPVSINEFGQEAPYWEAFACGTAAVVAPIGSVLSPTREWLVGDGEPGPVTMRLRDALIALQEGRAEDPFGWRLPVGRLQGAIAAEPQARGTAAKVGQVPGTLLSACYLVDEGLRSEITVPR